MASTATATTDTDTGTDTAAPKVTVPTRRYRLLRGTIARREHAIAHRDASTGKINDQYLNGTTVVYCAYDPEKENSAGNIIELTDDEAGPYLEANPPRVELIGGHGAHRVAARPTPSTQAQAPQAPVESSPVPRPAALIPAPAPETLEELAPDGNDNDMVAIMFGLLAPAAIELINGMETVAELQSARYGELAGRNRKGVIDAIDARMPDEV